MAQRRAGEITFYEYLGVTPDASFEEIRDAFRAMVRLLHPDQQTDPQLKQIAETQMRKLNRVYDVLSDPQRRLHYDATLEGDYRPAILLAAPAEPGRRRLLGRAAWVGAILVSASFLIWFAAEDLPAFPDRTLASSPAASISPDTSSNTSTDSSEHASQIARLRSELRSATVERDSALLELRRLRMSSPPGPGTSKTPASPEPPTAALPVGELPSIAKSAFVPAPHRQLAGLWYYSKPPQALTNRNPTLFPPEFIELNLGEENGVLRGKYRSRFQVADHAISPDVNFTFEGTAGAAQVSYPWAGPGGSRGYITLRLTSGNSLKIDWSANELGTQQSLHSGTAVLTRRIE